MDIFARIDVFEEPDRGDLSVVQFENLDFKPKRLFWISNVPPGQVRAKHWHRLEKQFLFAIRGEFRVRIESKEGISVNSVVRGSGADLPTDAWIEIYDFSTGAVAGVLSSRDYDPTDCHTDYDEFRKVVLQAG